MPLFGDALPVDLLCYSCILVLTLLPFNPFSLLFSNSLPVCPFCVPRSILNSHVSVLSLLSWIGRTSSVCFNYTSTAPVLLFLLPVYLPNSLTYSQTVVPWKTELAFNEAWEFCWFCCFFFFKILFPTSFPLLLS